MRAVCLALLSLTTVAAVACVPPEPDTDAIVNYDPDETIMGEIQERKRLLVGVPVDRPPFAEFAFNLGKLVGDALGVTTEPIPVDSDEILDAAEEQKVDIAFPVVTITERLVRHYAVSDPYYIGHQRLLVRKDSAVEQVADLDGVVCQYVDERTGVNLTEVNPDVRPIAPPEPRECVSMLQTGDVEAITASDWLLVPLLVENPGVQIVGDELTTEAYGAVIETGASAWHDFVNDVFSEAGAEGDWERFHKQAFGPYLPPALYPDMTVEEAAALYPSDL